MTREKKLDAGLQNLYSAQPTPEAVAVLEAPAPVSSAPAPTPVIVEARPATIKPALPVKPKFKAEAAPVVVEEQLGVFRLGEEHYAVTIEAVESIIKMQTLTIVPRAPKCVEGVTNLRGDVLLVIDLRARLGFKRVPQSPETRIVVCNWKGVRVGMLVDGVSEVARVNHASIEPPSPIVVKLDTGFVRGLARAGDRLIILLDLQKVLTLN